MAPSASDPNDKTSAANDAWNDTVNHIKKTLKIAEFLGKEYPLYGVVDSILHHCLQGKNQELVKKSCELRLFVFPQYQLALDFSNPDVFVSNEESGLDADEPSGTGSDDTQSEATEEGPEPENYQIPDFAVIADNSNKSEELSLELVPFLVEVKPFIGSENDEARQKELSKALANIIVQLFLQAKASFDTYPTQRHVHIFCVLGRYWKMLRFERAVLTKVSYQHDNAENDPDLLEPQLAIDQHDIVSRSTQFYTLLDGNDLNTRLKYELTMCLNQYEGLNTRD